ncbi:hypothetical protein LOK49_LG12G02620 [Camellia lanceoleosa]|uniref:Uncharacterized protein n=2 Tax=Camellia lanceoleosa TaxID=1840588 RepID=A0ACC0FU46_9ERIC|nr:hypothetical protein LOK49_LG12G02621 [Camellia lanceoleosa]KAI7991895.1 hypothetical protein LOK49_LG12G02620 [Camellia lanceoleosa]
MSLLSWMQHSLKEGKGESLEKLKEENFLKGGNVECKDGVELGEKGISPRFVLDGRRCCNRTAPIYSLRMVHHAPNRGRFSGQQGTFGWLCHQQGIVALLHNHMERQREDT